MVRNLTIVLMLFSFSMSLFAQTLPHTFEDGEVIFAGQVNENFQFVLENGGCSVEQIEEGAVIRCGDGSEAIIASAGKVIAYPQGNFSGDTVASIGTGDVVLKDANGVVLGKVFAGGGGNYKVEVMVAAEQTRSIQIVNNLDSSTVSAIGSTDVYYAELNCTGQAFSGNWSEVVGGADGQYLAALDSDYVFTVVNSTFSYGICSNGEGINQFYPVYPLTLPDAILNAAFPVSAHQE